MPLGTRATEALCARFIDVTGKIEIPSSSMRNGYSFVPCDEPRYFAIRSRLTDLWLVTR